MKWILLSAILVQSVDPVVLRQKSLEAREILKKESVMFKRAGKSKNSKIIFRDILLAVDFLSGAGVEVVRLEVDVLSGKMFKFKVITPGYRVERTNGLGITRLQFNVWKSDGEKLVVWDSRQLHLEDNRTSPRDLFYFLHSDIFLQEEFILGGKEFLLGAIGEVRKEMCLKKIISRAFPGKELCRVYVDADKYLASLAASEQIDDGELGKIAFNKFLIHIERNKEQAFYYSVSRDGARGLMQFMNSRRIKTYQWVLDSYPEAELISDFEKGSAHMKNSIKAAWLLWDLNLSQLPLNARNILLISPKLGGLLGAAAHNAGWKSAEKLYKEIVMGKITGSTKSFEKSRVPKETEGFLKKFSFVWNMISERR